MSGLIPAADFHLIHSADPSGWFIHLNQLIHSADRYSWFFHLLRLSDSSSWFTQLIRSSDSSIWSFHLTHPVSEAMQNRNQNRIIIRNRCISDAESMKNRMQIRIRIRFIIGSESDLDRCRIESESDSESDRNGCGIKPESDPESDQNWFVPLIRSAAPFSWVVQRCSCEKRLSFGINNINLKKRYYFEKRY